MATFLKEYQASAHRLLPALAVILVLSVGAFTLTGCNGDEAEGERDDIHLVYVNWVEGVAMAHVMDAVLQDSLGMEVERTELAGGGPAFTSVVAGDADVMTEVWLPNYHREVWDEHSDELVQIGQWYDRTSGGIAVPTYTDIHTVDDLAQNREALNNEIHGIEEGAPMNQQVIDVLAENDIEEFNVIASSAPATWAALDRAVSREEDIAVTAWRPHWKWGRFDLRYIEGAQTGDTEVFGDPESIYSVARNDFADEFPADVVGFFENVHVEDEHLDSLMQPFRPGADVDDPMEAAREWIEDNRDLVSSWMPEHASEEMAAQ